MKSIFVLVSVLFAPAIFAQESNTLINPQRLSGEITFDGIVNESSWLDLDPFQLTMHWPNFGGELTEETRIYLAYDDEFIYVAAICYDQNPEKIQAPSFQRDSWNEKMDQVAIILDSYNDNENALIFVVTASGSRVDASVKNDAQGGDVINQSWNSYWDAKASRFNEGWQLEMKIPISSLRFQVNDNISNMGVGAYRFIPRKREMQVYPAIPPDWGYWSFVKPSRLTDSSFENINSSRPWYISPYALGGLGFHQEYDANDVATEIDDNNLQFGLDVQHAFTDNLNADFTFNTDFAQVEADDQAVNLSRFSLFFPEKRRFFLERSSTFDFKADGNNYLFYSRKIGINGGELIPILGGVRFVGRVNSWDAGFINMQSQKIDGFASENFGVLRLRKNVFNARSYMGGMMTSRIDTEGEDNYAFGFDGIVNVLGDDYFKFNFAHSIDSQDPDSANTLDRSRIYLLWENRKTRGFGYSFSYSNVGNDYNPGLGFERRFNFSEFQASSGYLYFVDESRNLNNISISIRGETSLNNSTASWETRSFGGDFGLSWDRNNSLSFGANFLIDRVPSSFSLSDEIEIIPDEYRNTEYSVSYSTAPGGLISSSFNVQAGKFYGGDRITASISPNAVLSKYLQLSGYYQYSAIDFKNINELFLSHLARIRMNLAFNVKWSVSTFAQLNTLSEISTVNFRLRFNPVDGNDLFLVYNEILNNNRNSFSPSVPLSESRAIMLKYVHTFRL
tara:strand:- start:3654 stop:5855 length:2202 start_codon:yes stop_codon:yes gene_type:complete